MENIKVLGIDLAKNVFQLHGYSESGKTVLSKAVKRGELVEFVSKLKPCVIGMEACGGSHHWGRLFEAMGHEVRLVAPQYVKGFVRGNKTDRRDAQAIGECVSRPEMRLVALKTRRQQEIASMHRVRDRLVRSRTALSNEVRGLLHEFGDVVGTGMKKLLDALLLHAGDAEHGLSEDFRSLLIEARVELMELSQKIRGHEQQIEKISQASEVCRRLVQVPGVGPITATALVAHVGNARVFKNGREMSAYLGLVPRQHSSGGKTQLLGITKRGDKSLRRLLIHGARSVVRLSAERNDPLRKWVHRIELMRGRNKAVVALANKNARILWALIAKGENYRPAQEKLRA